MKVKYTRIIEYEGEESAIKIDLLMRHVKDGAPYNTTKYTIKEIELTKENCNGTSNA